MRTVEQIMELADEYANYSQHGVTSLSRTILRTAIEKLHRDASKWHEYKARKDAVIAAGMGRNPMRDTATCDTYGDTAPNNGVRCPGRYEPALDGFGKPSPQCTGCLRRIAGYPPGRWYFTEVPVFDDVCPQRRGAEA